MISHALAILRSCESYGRTPCRVEMTPCMAQRLAMEFSKDHPEYIRMDPFVFNLGESGLSGYLFGLSIVCHAQIISLFKIRCLGDLPDLHASPIHLNACWLIGDRCHNIRSNEATFTCHQVLVGRTFAKFFLREPGGVYRLTLLEEVEGLRSQDIYRPKPCQGCIDYCGETHGGNQLICGIHPSGPGTETCPDWRGKS